MFEIDTKIKQEALNFAVLMNSLEYTEHKLEPLFEEFGKIMDVSIPMDSEKAMNTYVYFFQISPDKLRYEYREAYKSFSRLLKTDEIIKRGSPDYPSLLLETEQAPRFLYIRGRKSLLSEKRTVALVGSRNASEIAKDNTRRVAESLGRNGITVVSGLAKGIDVTPIKVL